MFPYWDRGGENVYIRNLDIYAFWRCNEDHSRIRDNTYWVLRDRVVFLQIEPRATAGVTLVTRNFIGGNTFLDYSVTFINVSELLPWPQLIGQKHSLLLEHCSLYTDTDIRISQTYYKQFPIWDGVWSRLRVPSIITSYSKPQQNGSYIINMDTTAASCSRSWCHTAPSLTL